MQLNHFDQLLQASRPTVMMPLHSELSPLQEDGERILIGKNGIFMEFRRPWLKACVKIQGPLPVSVPYGPVTEYIELLCGTPPSELLNTFLAWSREAFPIECGAILTWKPGGRWNLRQVESTSASAAHLEFVRPPLDPDEHLIVDIHSHGAYDAHFSHTDNVQDAVGELKIAGVLGNVNRNRPSQCWRLCFNEYIFPSPSIHARVGFGAIELPDLLNVANWPKWQ